MSCDVPRTDCAQCKGCAFGVGSTLHLPALPPHLECHSAGDDCPIARSRWNASRNWPTANSAGNEKLSERISLLCGLLGQQMPVPVGMDIGSPWRALSKLGLTGEILLRLARDFKTSLLRCYRSLVAHWDRKKALAGLV